MIENSLQIYEDDCWLNITHNLNLCLLSILYSFVQISKLYDVVINSRVRKGKCYILRKPL